MPTEPPAPLPFEEVYKLYAGAVYRFCLSLVRNPEIAEDIGAETFVAAYAVYDRRPIDPEGLRPWLFRIARNLVSDHRRRERTKDRIMQVLGRSATRIESVEQVAAINAELAKVLRVMARMKNRDRQLLALRAGGGLSYREVAEVLHMSERAAVVATHRAIEKFRQLSEEDV